MRSFGHVWIDHHSPLAVWKAPKLVTALGAPDVQVDDVRPPLLLLAFLLEDEAVASLLAAGTLTGDDVWVHRFFSLRGLSFDAMHLGQRTVFS